MNVRPKYGYSVVSAQGSSFAEACDKVVSTVAGLAGTLVRVVFFGDPADRAEYVRHLGIIEKTLEKRFGDSRPVFSYVPQPPMGGSVAAECHILDDDSATVLYKSVASERYMVVECGSFREVIAGGLRGDIHAPLKEQCEKLFSSASAILSAEGMVTDDIVRQWNYIEDITGFVGEYQNYQVFNDARTCFYESGEWPCGYPAATGIGAGPCGVVVDFNAVRGGDVQTVPLDNGLQVPAHDYSQNVLLGAEDGYFRTRTTPKFERGKAVLSRGSLMSYISGTASIRGEKSVGAGDVIAQTVTTMENIDYLVSPENLARYGATVSVGAPHYDLLRVYVKRREDMPAVRDYMCERYPMTSLVFLNTDVCRSELLVEIEGVASYENEKHN